MGNCGAKFSPSESCPYAPSQSPHSPRLLLNRDWLVKEMLKWKLGGEQITIDSRSVSIENQLTTTDMSFVAKVLCSNCSITDLSFSDTSLGDDGAEIIAESLRSIRMLRRLYLNKNRISNTGAEALFNKAIHLNTTLRVLELHSNQIGDDAAKSLARALYTCNSIENLDLSNNFIGDEGAAALSRVLPSTKLHFLHLHRNRIGFEGMGILLRGICLNQTLTVVNLRNQRGASRLYGVEGLRCVYRLVDAEENGVYTDKFNISDVLGDPLSHWLSLRSIGSIGDVAENEEKESKYDEEGCMVLLLEEHNARLHGRSQAKLLEGIYANFTAQIRRELETAESQAIPLLLERIASTNGTKGLFSLLRNQPSLVS
uniref:Uncharacterized protein n=1 Tax=Odontella aurita TaxID=265563 RepID=A0A7S4MPH1_9STRA|mmetsp:Transcript_27968/g.82240  ORF Transcript_27968/g.82240 Transcript_27968/m.82240 type:complete len:371 (+) Transcript_27968:289-1401(+)